MCNAFTKYIRAWFPKLQAKADNAELFAEIQRHWPDQKLSMDYLIAERWQKADDKNDNKIERYNYLVFIDKEGDLDWVCNDDVSKQDLKSDTSCLIAKILDVEAYPLDKLSKGNKRLFKRMLGAAIVSTLEEGYHDAEDLLSNARRFLQDRINEKSRAWTLASTLCVCGVAMACVRLFRLGDDALCCAMIFGMSGAYFSIVRRSGQRMTDANAGLGLHVLEVVARISIGMIMGVVALALAGCDAAPEILRKACDNPLARHVVCFAAGLFDSLVPSLITQYILVKPKEANDE